MENKNKIYKKNYNSNKTFVQISKQTHSILKDFCNKNGLKIKDFLDNLIINNTKI
jgi:hypothetical protein